MTMNELSKNSHAIPLETLYNRVIDRVCSLYQETSKLPTDDQVIARLQQKWQDKLTLYTGPQTRTISDQNVDTDDILVESSSEEESDSSDSDESSSFSSSSLSAFSDSAAVLQEAIGQPSAQWPSAAMSTTSSVFTKMENDDGVSLICMSKQLRGKPKLHQLDGSGFDTEDEVEYKEAADMTSQRQELPRKSIVTTDTLTVLEDLVGEEKDDDRDDEEDKMDEESSVTCEEEGNVMDDRERCGELLLSPTKSAMSSSSLVSSDDLAPVSGLSGINLPILLAADYSKFIYRGKRRGYIGQLHAIVLTWPRRLEAHETVHVGDLVWCYPESALGPIDEGELAEVISVHDARHEVRIGLGRENEAMVSMDRIRRLSEYRIRRGSVRLQTKQ